MGHIIFLDSSKFTRFFIKDLFSNELVSVSELEFDEIVTNFRDLYELEYDGPNAQNFIINGVIEARRERG